MHSKTNYFNFDYLYREEHDIYDNKLVSLDIL